MSKLEKKGLLRNLENLKNDAISLWEKLDDRYSKEKIDNEIERVKQVHAQLEEIVEGYFKYDYLRNDPECRSVDEILEEKARQQKPAMTSEWVEELAEECYEVQDMGFSCKSVIEKAIKELGLEMGK